MPPMRLPLCLLGIHAVVACAGNIPPKLQLTDPCSNIGGSAWVLPQDARACMFGIPFDKGKQENVSS